MRLWVINDTSQYWAIRVCLVSYRLVGQPHDMAL
jgi:hypothetical protein